MGSGFIVYRLFTFSKNGYEFFIGAQNAPYEKLKMRSITPVSPPFLTIITTGFTSTIAQILVLRELLVLLYGNEISTGLVFFFWLLWTAFGSALTGRLNIQPSQRNTILAFLLILLSLILPLLVLVIRGAHFWFVIPQGELPSIGKVILITIGATGLFCPLSGALFSICWTFQNTGEETDRTGQPLMIYFGEAIGAAFGGLLFYFLFFPHLSTLTISFFSSFLMLLIAGWIIKPWHGMLNHSVIFSLWLFLTGLTVLGMMFNAKLEYESRYLQWDENPVATLDTPYHHITLLKKENQVSVFTNGLWLFSEPDKLSAEFAVHTALLQVSHPRTVLLLGGGIAGHIAEILKHPGILSIDYLEPDPELISFTAPYLSNETQNHLKDKKVHLYHEDPVTFLQSNKRSYDIVLMNMGDPINAEMNRFYTKEFFQNINHKLLPGGIFSFSVSGGREMMGPVQARLIRSLQKTLLQVFPNVLMYPGDHIRFFASNKTGNLTTDVATLTSRISERNLDLSYIRKDILRDILNPFQLNYLKSLLSELDPVTINRDFSPTCYFHTLMLWAYQWHPKLEHLLSSLSTVHWKYLWAGLITAGVLCIVFFWTGEMRFKTAVFLSVMAAGAIEIVLQVVLLLTFQVLEGFVYLQLALIIAFFMAGAGLGAGFISWWIRNNRTEINAFACFIRIQALLSLLPLFIIFLLTTLHGDLRQWVSSTTMGWLFSSLSLVSGFIGGSHFSLAFLTLVSTGDLSKNKGGIVYALDLAGASFGILIATVFILPVYGFIHSLLILSMVSAISLLILLRHP